MNSPMPHTSQAANTLVPARPAESRNPCLRLVRSRVSRERLDSWLERVPETAGRYQLRGVTGIIFMVFGLMKIFDTTLPILVGAPGLQVTTGAEGFARLIAGLGIPFPLLNAWMVIAVELLCGLGLILAAWLPATRLVTRLCALPLLGDMMVALLVGIREVQGRPVMLDGLPVMNQFWRLPLELGLLLGMAYLLWRPVPRAEVSRPVPVPVPVPVRVTEKRP
ncbi:DoxX family protein [Archangium violaceum]|uniref:DoxX family protein n=1 Tax=Archangium violaceum TaxID=83451 RepID=UPI00194E1007|nr:DoxX family protein [Archangium violaceum]QRN98047.1 DoxX family protein [Archangium violaceum]